MVGVGLREEDDERVDEELEDCGDGEDVTWPTGRGCAVSEALAPPCARELYNGRLKL